MNRLKSFTLLLGGFLLVFTTSCTKENDPQDGEFSPGKKIHKITFENVYDTVIREIWHWNGNNLSSIERFRYGSIYYDDYGEIHSLESNEVRKTNLEFKYNGRRVSRIDYLSEDSTVFFKQSVFEYEGDRIKLIAYYGRYKDLNVTTTTDTLFVNIKWDFAYQDEKLSQVVETNSLFIHNTVYNLTWEGDNLIQVEIVGDNSTTSTVLLYEYDTKNNPWYGHYDEEVDKCICAEMIYNDKNCPGFTSPTVSKNNCTKKISKWKQSQWVCNIGYLYDEDGYPTKATITENGNSYNLYYEYK